MTRIKQITISAIATVALTAAVSAPASAYSTPNATLGSPAAESPAASDRSFPNAVLGESRTAAGDRLDVSSPNAILGAGNVVEAAGAPVTVTGSAGFDWTDAFIGAAGAVGLLLLTSGVALMYRRRHVEVQPIS